MPDVINAEEPPGRASRLTDLVTALLIGVLLSGTVGGLLGLFLGAGVATGARHGAMTGLGAGLAWYWQARRGTRYRASFDPADRSLTVAPTGTVTDPPSAVRRPARRYRPPAPLFAIAALGFAGSAAVAVAASVAPDESGSVTWIFWGFAVLGGLFLGALLLTYTEVGPDGVVVHTPTTLWTVSWSDLVEVRWHRDANQDVLLFRTNDGRETKSAGVGIVDGYGERRMLRVLAHIKRAWATPHS